MTVVAALIEQSRVYIGSDTLVASENGNLWYGKSKFWKTNDSVIIGAAGELLAIEPIRYGFSFQAEVPTEENVNAWLQQVLELYKKETWAMLICGHGRIFQVNNKGLLVQSESFSAIGSGADLALGSLYSTSDDFNPEVRLRKAIDAGIYFDAYCGGRVKIEMI